MSGKSSAIKMGDNVIIAISDIDAVVRNGNELNILFKSGTTRLVQSDTNSATADRWSLLCESFGFVAEAL